MFMFIMVTVMSACLPILADGVPVAEIPSRNIRGKSGTGTRLNCEAIEVPQDQFRIVRSSQANVELGHFIANNLASICDGRCCSEHNIVQRRVTSGRNFTASRYVWLGASIGRAPRESVVDAVQWVLTGFRQRRAVEKRVDVVGKRCESDRVDVARGVVADGAVGWSRRCAASRWGVSRALVSCYLEVVILESRVGQPVTKFYMLKGSKSANLSQTGLFQFDTYHK